MFWREIFLGAWGLAQVAHEISSAGQTAVENTCEIEARLIYYYSRQKKKTKKEKRKLAS